MDLPTFFGLLITLVTFFLSLFTPARLVKDLLRVIAGTALVEALLLAVSMPIWARVVIGLVFFAAGAALVVRANRKVPQEHADQIHAVLGRVSTALENDSASNLEKPDLDIITRHFPKIAKQVKAWDNAVSRVAESKQALRTSVEEELHDLRADKSPYNFGIIRDGLCAITEARIADRAASDPFPPMTGPESDRPIFIFHPSDEARFVFLAFNKATGATGELARLEGSEYPGHSAHSFDEEYGKPIYEFLREMQTWNPTKNFIMKRQELEKLSRDTLERAVKKQRDKSYYRRARGCPDCK
jgi:hypothetical protein